MRGSPPTSHENYQVFSSPLMGEDRGGGGHGVFPLTPALSHQGRGGTSSYFLRNSNGQNSNYFRLGHSKLEFGYCLEFGVSPLVLDTTLRSQCPPSQPPLSPAGERDRVRGTTLIILNLHRAIRTKKVHGYSIAP
jgi:hypothetical protein